MGMVLNYSSDVSIPNNGLDSSVKQNSKLNRKMSMVLSIRLPIKETGKQRLRGCTFADGHRCNQDLGCMKR